MIEAYRIGPKEADRGKIEDSILQRQFARPTGPGAGVVKYDVITALSILALRESQTVQTTALRLIALVTARYNWKRDLFSVPQADMARMWDVSERTVKREIKRMVSAGFITCVRQGVRGRVGAYRLNYPRLCDRSRDFWPAVGADYAARMHTMRGPADAKVVKADFSTRPTVAAPPVSGEDPWSLILQELQRVDPANLQNWYMKLRFVTAAEDRLRLAAPSRFVAQFVQTHLSPALERAVAEALQKPLSIEIIV